MLNRCGLCIRLLFCIVFFFPRIYWKMFVSFYNILLEETSEDYTLFRCTFFTPPVAAFRKSLRKNKNRSPSRKRKHDDLTAGERSLPEYLVCIKNYSEECDPDYVPDSDGEDTENTSASERSHIESGAEDETEEEEEEEEIGETNIELQKEVLNVESNENVPFVS